VIKLLLADDHAIVRDGLKQILSETEDLRVAGEATNGHEVLQRVREEDWGLVLLDMSMPGKSGIELIKQLKKERPKLRILVLSMHEEHQYAVRAFKAGAVGYLTKNSHSSQLLTAIRKVARGGAYVSPALAEKMALTLIPDTDAPPHTLLSDREYQIFRMIVSGKAISEIAAELSISAKTVSTHKSRIMKKLHMTNQTELIRYALQHHLIDGPDA
jgi:Response regulator containing a CheY-like receiver domain and an HTH DNA-binding domain